jgi:hypothetical protein
LIVLALFAAPALVGCASGASSSSGGASSSSGAGTTIANEVVAKLAPQVGEQMDPTAEEAKAGVGASLDGRLTAIIEDDPTMKIVNVGHTPDGVWYSFSDGSSLEFHAKQASDGTRRVTTWTVTKH